MLLKSVGIATLLAVTSACAKPSALPEQPKVVAEKAAAEEHKAPAPIAVLLLMDRSGSMSGPKADGARAAAKASLRTLTPESLFGLIAFDQLAVTVVQMQHASGRRAIEVSIDEFKIGGGTDVRPAL